MSAPVERPAADRRPTAAQLAVLRRMAEGEMVGQLGGGYAFMRWPEGSPRPHLVSRIRITTWIGLCERRLVDCDLEITPVGRAEVSIADGAFAVAWPCAECHVVQRLRVRTYREIQRDGIGICCYACWSTALIEGERKRRAALAASAGPGTEEG